MFTNFNRVLKNSWRNFSRNLWLSLATLGMMTLALIVIGSLVLFNASVDGFVAGLRDKVDVSVYFKTDASEEDINVVMEELRSHPQVREVRYVSREEALAIFTEGEDEGSVALEALRELDGNPLEASLNIKVHSSEDFVPVLTSLETSEQAKDIISEIDYSDREAVINKVNTIAANVSLAGTIFTVALAIFVFLVTYNTIRLAIYTAKDEIHIMKLVGASNWYVRGPFILAGAIYGVTAATITLGLMFAGAYGIGSIGVVFSEINFFGYLVQNILWVAALLFGAGIFLGAASSYYAVRRYLNV